MMAAGVSGYLEFDSSVSWGKVRVYYAETYNVATNKSDLTITSIQVKSTKWSGVGYYLDGVLKINGVEVLRLSSSTGNASVDVQSKNTWYTAKNYATGVITTAVLRDIAHATNGSKSVEIELTGNRFTGFRFYSLDGSGESGWYVDASKLVELTTIPRASDIGATDANIGSVAAITVTKKSPAYTHTIKYTFGKLSGYLESDGSLAASAVHLTETSIAFLVPTSFYSQIPNAISGVCTLICTTYSGNTQIGDSKSTEFVVTAAQSLCAPLVGGTVVDSNELTRALTGDSSKLVKFFSNALCTISAEARNAASIKQQSIGGVNIGAAEITRTISRIEASSVEFTATDSRGYLGRSVVPVPLVNYIKLTANVSFTRDNPTNGRATLRVQGDYFNDTFGAQRNAITVKFRVARSDLAFEDYQSAAAEISGNTYSVQIPLQDLDYESQYKAQVVVADKVMMHDKTVVVSKGIPVFDWGETDFRFNVPVLLSDNSFGTSYPDNPKKGQVFLLKNQGDGYAIRIFNGTTWT